MAAHTWIIAYPQNRLDDAAWSGAGDLRMLPSRWVSLHYRDFKLGEGWISPIGNFSPTAALLQWQPWQPL